MNARTRQLLLTLLAPITVPLSILFMAGANLLGGAFYIVIEASLARVVGRPITLSRKHMVFLAIPVLVAAPFALVALLLLWLLRQIGSLLCWLGNWQAGTVSRARAFAAGLLWVVVAVWTTVSCLNAAVGLAILLRPVQKASDAFVEYQNRRHLLGDLPPEAQQRRQALIEDLAARKELVHPQWRDLLPALQDDECPFKALPLTVGRLLTGLPWFFYPGEVSEDGSDHSVLLLGPLLFAWMLLIRWPGTFVLLRDRWFRAGWFLLRTFGAAFAIYYLITWVPSTAYAKFWFDGNGPADVPFAFKLLSPAYWLGYDPLDWVRPQWYLFNAGLWLVLIGLVAFIWWLAWRISPFVGWPRYYVAFLASRLLQRKRIAFFSVGAVTLCVAMMIIVISVMGGFVDSIRNRAHGLLGDLVMNGGQAGFPYYREFIDQISRLRDKQTGEPIVLQATPLIQTYGILKFEKTEKTKAVRIWGIYLDEYVRVNEFGRDLFYQRHFGCTTLGPTSQPVWGEDEKGVAVLPDGMDRHYYQDYLPSLPRDKQEKEEKEFRRDPGGGYPGPGVFEPAPGPDDHPGPPGYIGRPYPGVIIGRDILFRRLASGEYPRNPDYPVGEQCLLTMLPLTRGGDISAEPPPKPSFRYVDDSRTGIFEIDSMNVYVDFDILQRLLSMEAQQRAEGRELYLFTVPEDGIEELKKGVIPDSLRTAFSAHEVPLVAEARVVSTAPEKQWKITSSGQAFVIRKETEGLDIFSGTSSPRCSQIQIKLQPAFGRDRDTLDSYKKLINEQWKEFCSRLPLDMLEVGLLRLVDTQTWEEMQHDYISAIEKEKFLVLIMFGVISVVAVFLILCIFYMIVQEKTRDIGIIKSVGGSAEGVTAVFLAYGAAIGLVGCVLGSLLGITFVEHINGIQDFLARMNPAWRVWSPETYSFDKIPDVWKWSEVCAISVLAILASIAGAAFPALRAGRTWPVETLRYE